MTRDTTPKPCATCLKPFPTTLFALASDATTTTIT